jgi:hypothetical protein
LVYLKIYSLWSRRKLLKIRDKARQYIKFEVGNGSDIFLCMDCWHPLRILFDNYGYQVIIYDRCS